jgi:hypothetical protein
MTRIVVVGPLAGHEDGLRLRLTEDGYALDTVRGHVRLHAGVDITSSRSGSATRARPPGSTSTRTWR